MLTIFLKWPIKTNIARMHTIIVLLITLTVLSILYSQGSLFSKRVTTNNEPRLPRLPSNCTDVGFKLQKGFVSLSLKYSPCCQICKIDNGKPHIITNFFHPVHAFWRRRSDNPNNITIAIRRLDELIYVLNKKLSDERIAAVHILFNHPYTLFFMQRYLKVENKHRLILHQVDTDPSHADTLAYVNEYLLNRIIIFMNQDIYFDEGLERLNKSLLCDQNITYALSRYGRTEKYCNMQSEDQCSKKYFGSHDTYIFCLQKPVNMSNFELLRSKIDNLGLENLWIWAFRNLGFKVLNPCYVLKTYHVHCNSMRSRKRDRLNTEYSGSAIPTDALM